MPIVQRPKMGYDPYKNNKTTAKKETKKVVLTTKSTAVKPKEEPKRTTTAINIKDNVVVSSEIDTVKVEKPKVKANPKHTFRSKRKEVNSMKGENVIDIGGEVFMFEEIE